MESLEIFFAKRHQRTQEPMHFTWRIVLARDRTCITSNHRTGDGGLSGEGGVKKGAK